MAPPKPGGGREDRVSRLSWIIVGLVGLSIAMGGCKEERKKKTVSRTVTDRKKKEDPIKRPKTEGDEDEHDQAWNEPPTPGRSKVRMVLTTVDGPIKGRPSFMASQFALVASEMHEALSGDGDEPTGKKRTFEFNPNDSGRYVFELPPGRWQLNISDVDKEYLPWDSSSLIFLGDDTRAVDVVMKRVKPE